MLVYQRVDLRGVWKDNKIDGSEGLSESGDTADTDIRSHPIMLNDDEATNLGLPWDPSDGPIMSRGRGLTS